MVKIAGAAARNRPGYTAPRPAEDLTFSRWGGI